MNRHIVLVIGPVLLSGYRPDQTLASERPRDLGSAVRAVFAAKCTGCHGPDLVKPKGRFGYVLDLVRVAANREMVIPFSPDKSALWELVKQGEMPPDDAPSGALTVRQKEVIRAWIAAGAPAPVAGAPQPNVSARGTSAPEPPTLSSLQRMLIIRLVLFGVLVLAFALLIDLGVGGLMAALLGSVRVSRQAMRDPQPAGDSWGTALSLIAAVLVGFLAWGYLLSR